MITKFTRRNPQTGDMEREQNYSVRVPLPAGSEQKHFTKRNAFPSKEAAKKFEREFKSDLRAGWVGKQLHKLRERATGLTIRQLIEDYIADDYPDRQNNPRPGLAAGELPRQLRDLAAGLGSVNPSRLTARNLTDYRDYRRRTVQQGTGNRTAELEIVALSNLINWAVHQDILDRNPIQHRERFVDPKDIRHAREVMPASGDELHRLAGTLLADPRSAVLGWALLWGAFTGLRFGEIRLLRSSPCNTGTGYEPGYIHDNQMHVTRLKRGLQTPLYLDHPHNPEIRPLLERIKQWRATHYARSPWLFPGRQGHQLTAGTLAKALTRVCTRLKLPARTAHGARAYYTTARISHGATAAEVAIELGQKSGEDLVKSVYGALDGQIPAWAREPGVRTWLPNTANVEPAWQAVKPAQNIIAL